MNEGKKTREGWTDGWIKGFAIDRSRTLTLSQSSEGVPSKFPSFCIQSDFDSPDGGATCVTLDGHFSS